MKVLNRADFLRLPEGTIYAKGVRWAFDGLSIKSETLGNDWLYFDLAWVSAHDSGEAANRLDEMLERGTSYPLEDARSRDGLFDNDAVFLIFERSDLEVLRGHVDHALRIVE